MKPIQALALLPVATIVLSVAGAPASEVHVSPTGLDSNPGTTGKPLQTIAAAVEAVRGKGGATIWLKGGIYSPGQTIALGKADSGSGETPLVIRAVAGEEVIVSGGRKVPSNLFKALPDGSAKLNRLPEAARGKVVAASLAGTGMDQCFTYQPDLQAGDDYTSLAWDGHMLQLAQWPNLGYAYIKKTIEKGATTRWLKPGENAAPYTFDKPSGGLVTVREGLDFKALDAELQRTRDMYARGYLAVDWLYENVPLAKVDPEKKTLQFLKHVRYGVDFKDKKLPRRFRIVNALCQLDEPGEWYFDHYDKLLYVWPVEPVSAEKPFTITGGPALIKGDGVEHVTIRDITFENFGDLGVAFTGSKHILIGGCTFRNGKDLGVSLTNGMHNTIQGCDFHDLYRAFILLGQDPRPEALENDTIVFRDPNASYIKLGYSQNRMDLVPEHNVATNNHIHHCRLRGYGLLTIGGVGATFSHNLIHGVNGGMLYGHNDLVMEFNEFYDAGYEMGDWNICYNGADKALMNNQIRNNFFHHMIQTPKGYGIAAIRVDDYGAGLNVSNCIFYKAGQTAVTFRGPFSSMENCVVMEMGKVWHTTQLPSKKMPRDEYYRQAWSDHLKMQEDIANGAYCIHEKENYIGRIELAIGKEGWNRNEAWKKAYPKYASLFEDPTNPDCNPWNNSHCSVLANYHDKASFKSLSMHGRNPLRNLEEAKAFLPATLKLELPHKLDPKSMFVNADDLDFRVRPGFKPVEGFKPIPFEKIGLVVDEFRRTTPDKAAYRKAAKAKWKDLNVGGGGQSLDEINTRYSPPPYLEGSGQ